MQWSCSCRSKHYGCRYHRRFLSRYLKACKARKLVIKQSKTQPPNTEPTGANMKVRHLCSSTSRDTLGRSWANLWQISALLTVFVAASTVTAVGQTAAQNRFKAVGIKWDSSGHCTRRTNPKCTSFEGLRETTVQGAITLKKACKCSLTITGGTETGHAKGTYSHGNGYKLDFRKNAGINNYIKKNFKRISNLGSYPRYWAPSGNIYMVGTLISYTFA